MENYVYADNAATTKPDKKAIEAMYPYFFECYANPSQPYSFSRAAKKALKDSREMIADCIGAEPEEIYFTSGGTESNNWALNLIKNTSFHNKSILISGIEHHAIINPCKKLREEGVGIYVVNPDGEGIIAPKILDDVLAKKSVGMVSIMTANNEIGTIEPINDLSKTAHMYGAAFHTDAVQAAGHIAIDVKASGVDLLSASAHKFNGPKGVGFLYAKRDFPITPFIKGGSQENNLRAGTENVAAIVGMAYALRENCSKLEENKKYIERLENRLLSGLNSSGADFLKNGSARKLPGLLSISFDGLDGEAILHRMDLLKIAISTGSACDSKRTEISHVLKSIGLDERRAKGTIRVSLGKYNTETDVDRIVDALVKIVRDREE